MAEQDDEREMKRRYRELPREEPPPALDAAIRAEARRAAVTHPAPLVPPTGRRTWYFPVAAAAVIMLAVAVTSQVEREQIDPALPPQAAAPEPEGQKERKFAEAPPEKPEAQKQDLLRYKSKGQPPPKVAEAPAAAAPAPAARPAAPPPPSAAEEAKNQAPQSVTGAIAQSREDSFGQRDNRARQERPSSGIASAPAPERRVQKDEAETRALAKLAQEPPEKWLERIARLRQEGRHDEADKALAEFRKAYPEYRISESMLEKVEKK